MKRADESPTVTGPGSASPSQQTFRVLTLPDQVRRDNDNHGLKYAYMLGANVKYLSLRFGVLDLSTEGRMYHESTSGKLCRHCSVPPDYRKRAHNHTVLWTSVQCL